MSLPTPYQMVCEWMIDDLREKMASRRKVRRAMPWLALTAFLLLALASVARAQATPTRAVVLWAPPPVIGMYTRDSMRVDEALPMLATADWPAFADTALAELRACTGLHAGPGLAGWTLHTVAAPMFAVRVWDREAKVWRADAPFIGFTFPSLHRIYVVQGGLFVRGLIKHEMLHALLATHGIDPRHSTPVSDVMFARCLPERPR